MHYHRSIIAATAAIAVSTSVAVGVYILPQTTIQADINQVSTQEIALPAIVNAPETDQPKPQENTKPSVIKNVKPTKQNQESPSDAPVLPAPSDAPPAPPPTPIRYPKHYGVNIKIYGMNKPYAPYNRANLIAQLDYAKELGAVDVRSNAEESLDDTDEFVNLAIERGLKPMLIIEPELPNFFNQATYTQGYNYANKIAKRYQGKVLHYQLGNEASGVAIKPTFPGNKKTDYDDTKYAVLKEWFKGMSQGVRDADPLAYRMISANWLGTGIMDRLVEDKVEFDLIGWNWYSDMGEDLIKEVDGAEFSIPEYLKKYPKEFWVVELNRQGGTLDGNEQAQADYLKTFINNAVSHNNLGGVFVFPLADLCPDIGNSLGHMGIIRLQKFADQSCAENGKKPAFDVIKDLFAKFKG